MANIWVILSETTHISKMRNHNLAKDLISNDSIWQICDGGYMQRHAIQSVRESVFVPTSALAAIDERLPEAIALYQQTVTRVTGGALHVMLKLWTEAVLLKTTNVKSVAVLETMNLDIGDKKIVIGGKGFEYKSYPSTVSQEPILIHSGTGWLSHEGVSVAWLDENYPNWLQKFEIAQSLSYTLHDSIKYMVSVEPTLLSLAAPTDLIL